MRSPRGLPVGVHSEADQSRHHPCIRKTHLESDATLDSALFGTHQPAFAPSAAFGFRKNERSITPRTRAERSRPHPKNQEQIVAVLREMRYL